MDNIKEIQEFNAKDYCDQADTCIAVDYIATLLAKLKEQGEQLDDVYKYISDNEGD